MVLSHTILPLKKNVLLLHRVLTCSMDVKELGINSTLKVRKKNVNTFKYEDCFSCLTLNGFLDSYLSQLDFRIP